MSNNHHHRIESDAVHVASPQVDRAVAALVESYDVIGLTVDLIEAAARSLGAYGGGVILRQRGQERLQIMATTSHRVEVLELFQAQHQHGPCYDAVETATTVKASGPEIARRWPDVAPAFDRAGFRQVLATPLRWHNEVLGALSVFATEGSPDLPVAGLQTYADLVTLAITNAAPLTTMDLLLRTREALNERTVIEQAKGVLAQLHGVDMETAYTMLLDQSRSTTTLLATTARTVIQNAVNRPTPSGD